MKELISLSNRIYIRIIKKLANKVENSDKIKPIVKRKIKLRVNDIERMYVYYNKKDVLGYMTNIRNISEGTHQILAIQYNLLFDKELLKVKPLPSDKELRDFIISNNL
jgi:hypothetical protein